MQGEETALHAVLGASNLLNLSLLTREQTNIPSRRAPVIQHTHSIAYSCQKCLIGLPKMLGIERRVKRYLKEKSDGPSKHAILSTFRHA